jgi:hypothetical protein
MTMPKRKARRSRETLTEEMLCRLQREVERAPTSSAEDRRRDRALIRGFRAALWSVTAPATLPELEVTLRLELGLPIHAVPAGTSTEVDDDD